MTITCPITVKKKITKFEKMVGLLTLEIVYAQKIHSNNHDNFQLKNVRFHYMIKSRIMLMENQHFF